MSSHRFSCRRFSHRRALLPLCIGIAITSPLAIAQASTPAAQQAVVAFDLPAGKLSTALNALARQAGLTLSVQPALLENKNAAATKGNFTVQQALGKLLAGSGLDAQVNGSSIAIIRKPTAGVSTLQTVKINAAALGATTEGTGSYTTGAASSAIGINLSLRETPQSVSVITRDRMQDQGLTQIADVMTQIVGISGSSTSALGSDGTQYISRGFAVENYMVDGVPRPTGVYGFAEETADMIAYDRVEVIHGAAGLMTGTGVPSASINLIRKRPTKEFAANITAQAGSWDLYRLETDVGGALTDSGSVRGRVAAAYQENDTFIDREHAERKVFYGVLETEITDSTLLTTGFEYQNFENKHASRGGIPLLFSDGSATDFSRSTNSGTDWSSFERESESVFIGLDHSFTDDWRLNLTGEHKQGEYDESIGYLYASDPIDRETGAGGTLYSARWGADDQRIDAINTNLQGAFDLLGRKHEVAVIASYAKYQDNPGNYPGWWSGDEYEAPVANAYDFYSNGDWPKPNLEAGGADSERTVRQSSVTGVLRLKPTDTLAVILGSRVSNWKDDTAGEENGVVTPYAGVVFDVTSTLSAYASYTSIFEPQTNVDIDGHRLDPLEGKNYEIGLKSEFMDGRFNASVALFKMEQDNYAVPLGAEIYAPDGSIANRAVSGAKVKGFELEAGGQVLPGWQIAGGYSRADGEDRDGATLQSQAPENTFKLFSTYQLRGDLSGLKVGGNLRWQNETWLEAARPNGADYVQGSFTLIDLQASYVFPQNVTLALHANNVFDKRYFSGLNEGGSRYGEPRSYNASVRYDF